MDCFSSECCELISGLKFNLMDLGGELEPVKSNTGKGQQLTEDRILGVGNSNASLGRSRNKADVDVLSLGNWT